MSEAVNTTSGELVALEAAVPTETLANRMENLATGGTGRVVSSFTGEDFATKLEVLSAINNSKPLSEHLGKKIQVRNIVIQAVDMQDETTKQMVSQPRVIFIEEDGTAYHAISGVLYRDVEDWYGLLGHPSQWPGALPVVVKQEGTGNRKFFTAKLTK